MIRTLVNTWSPVAVDFDARFIKAAQLRRCADGWHLAAAVRLPRLSADQPLDLPEARQLRGALARQDFHGRRIVLAVPRRSLLTGVLELPPRSSGAPLGEIARAELGRMHGFEPSEAETATWYLPVSARARDSTQVMAAACRHADAEGMLDVFESAGLEAVALDNHLHAIAKACGPLLAPDGITAVAEIEWDWATLALLHEGQVIYERAVVDSCLQRMSESLTRRFSLDAAGVDYVLTHAGLGGAPGPEGGDPAQAGFNAAEPLIRARLDAMAAEIQLPFDYAARQYPGSAVSRLLLLGRGAALPGIEEYFRSRLEVEVRVARPRDLLPCPAEMGAKADDPSLTVCLGLAQFFA